jgi:hypothetical protein
VESIKPNFKLFEKIFLESVQKGIKDKQTIGLLFSGGLDSRTVLAGLLKCNVKPICFTSADPNDVPLAKQITSDYDLSHIIFEKQNDHGIKTQEKILNLYKKDVDVFFTGLFFNELWEWNQWINKKRKLKTICSFANSIQINNHTYSPAIEDEVINFVFNLPKSYRKNRRITKELLKVMMPEMLEYKIRRVKGKLW